jgi:hypothetical protein
MGCEAIRAEALVKHIRDRNCHKLIQISLSLSQPEFEKNGSMLPGKDLWQSH